MDHLDFNQINERIKEFQSDPLFKDVLEQGSDPKSYARKIDQELETMERSLITEYLKQTNQIFSLNESIIEIANYLQGVEKELVDFKSQLSSFNTELSDMVNNSDKLNQKLKNKTAAYEMLNNFLDQILPSPQLIKNITERDINETYFDFAAELHRKLTYAEFQRENDIKSLPMIMSELELLKIKAVEKIRDYFIPILNSLKEPNTNIALIQKNVLLKYRPLYRFVMDHYNTIGMELHSNYAAVVSVYYSNSFEKYMKALEELEAPSLGKQDLIGSDEGSKRGFFQQSKTKDMPEVFGLGTRINVIKDFEQEVIVPHHATQRKEIFKFEFLFKSVMRLLMDNSSSEYLFTSEFFFSSSVKNPEALLTVFGQVFNNCFKAAFVQRYIDRTNDAVGVLLCIRLNSRNLRIMQKRKLPHLDNFLNLINLLLWPKFQAIMGTHTESLKVADARKLIVSKDTSSHFVSKRYADLAVAILTLNESFNDPILTSSLARMRTELEGLLNRLSLELGDKKLGLSFWINNLFHIQAALNECTGASFQSEKLFFKDAVDQKTEDFVNHTLEPHLGKMNAYIQQCENNGSSGDPKTMENLANDFNLNWKKALTDINGSTMQLFTNFQNGGNILHLVLSQFVLWYKRFLSLWPSAFKNQKTTVVPIGIQTVLAEVKKYRSSFQ